MGVASGSLGNLKEFGYLRAPGTGTERTPDIYNMPTGSPGQGGKRSRVSVAMATTHPRCLQGSLPGLFKQKSTKFKLVVKGLNSSSDVYCEVETNGLVKK